MMKRRAPAELWTAQTSAAADHHTMAVRGVPSAILMERAALAVARVCEAVRPDGAPLRVDVLCGPGNNGGDGLAVARILAHRGWEARAWRVTERRGESVEQQSQLAEIYGVELLEGPPAEALDAAVCVDALLGTGASGDPRGVIAEAVRALAPRPGRVVVAVDLPTGLDGDRGKVGTPQVVADHTVTFERSKFGLHMGPARPVVGRVHVAEIGLLSDAPSFGALIDPSRVADALASQGQAGHKGERGAVCVVGGAPGMAGAALLAGRGALAAGAGLVTVASDAPAFGAAALRDAPELMHLPRWSADSLPGGVLAVGPGWADAAQDARAAMLWREDPRPAVWDAGGLDAIDGASPKARVITPHPKEAARLLTRLGGAGPVSVAGVQADRRAAATELAGLTGAVVVLKGVGTVVADGERVGVCVAGSSALSTAGSGDVLCGVIAARLAVGRPCFDAACEGVHLHAAAGESLGVGPGPVAGDIAAAVGRVLADAQVGDYGAWPNFIAG